MKNSIEIRDPIHVFVRLSDEEVCIIESRPFQRLRDVHQLALSYFVYPGARHTRFEHSLGVMELASRIFDVVTSNAVRSFDARVRDVVPEDPGTLVYWRKVVRAAALFHDVGHLPFSHASESLLPDGYDHERLSRDLIMSEEMAEVWNQTTPPLRADDVAYVALEPTDGVYVDPWRALLREMITGDVFGADRMDYLLRDSFHAGVSYGHFDHHRLIDTMRILSPPAEEAEDGRSAVLNLGVTDGGLRVAEALLLARYAMYSQVYNHRTRKLYDVHLGDYLQEWLTDGHFSTDLERHLGLSDSRLLWEIQRSAADTNSELFELASRITDRSKRFKSVFEPSAADLKANPYATELVEEALRDEFESANIRSSRGGKGSDPERFPVLRRDGESVSSADLSTLLENVPSTRYEYIYTEPDLAESARSWLKKHKDRILENKFEPEANEYE